MAGGRLADQREPRAVRLDLVPGAIQLDRVCLAESSAVVAQPHQHGGLVAPQIPKTHIVAVLVGQDDVGQGVGPRRGVGPLPPCRRTGH